LVLKGQLAGPVLQGSPIQTFSRKAVTRIEVALGLLVVAGAGWLLIPSLGSGAVAAKRTQCLANLGRIGQALTSYLAESDQRWPYVAKLTTIELHTPPWPTLPRVIEKHLVGDVSVFHCPADRRELPADSPLAAKLGKDTTWFETEGTSYEWLWGEAYGGKKVGEESLAQAKGFGMGRADQPLLADFAPFHAGDGGGSFNTLNADLKPRTARDESRAN
jgi:hypothetical protein